MVTLAGKANVLDENLDEPEAVTVSLTLERLGDLLHLQRRFEKLAGEVPGLVHLAVTDDAPDWGDLALRVSDRWVRVPDGGPEIQNCHAVVGTSLKVTADGVWWDGYVKHADVLVESPHLSWAQLRDLYEFGAGSRLVPEAKTKAARRS